MKKTIKFLACMFAISAFAVACNNNPEQTEDTANTDTMEVIDTTVTDTVVTDTVAEPAPATTAKKTKTPKKEDNTLNAADPTKKAGKTGSKKDNTFTVKTGDPAANSSTDENLDNSQPKKGKKRNF